MLQSLRAQVASRLKDYRKEIAIRQKRAEREQKKRLLAERRSRKDSTDEFVLEDEPESSPAATGEPELSEDDRLLAESMTASLYCMGQVTGGPTQVFGYLSGNFAPPGASADQLVDLIETTINPDFWQDNGGDGVLHFYDPLCILVVSASSQVHDQITDLLRTLRYLQY